MSLPAPRELRADLALPQPRQIGMHRPLPGRRIGRAARVTEIEIGKHVLAPVAQLFGHIVVPIPYRGSLKRCIGNVLRRTGQQWGAAQSESQTRYQ